MGFPIDGKAFAVPHAKPLPERTVPMAVKFQPFLPRAVEDFGAAATAPLVLLGDRLGLYKAMAKSGPVSPAELAELTGTSERYLREWLSQQAASGYVQYDP